MDVMSFQLGLIAGLSLSSTILVGSFLWKGYQWRARVRAWCLKVDVEELRRELAKREEG